MIYGLRLELLRHVRGIYRDNGKEKGNYFSVGHCSGFIHVEIVLTDSGATPNPKPSCRAVEVVP